MGAPAPHQGETVGGLFIGSKLSGCPMAHAYPWLDQAAGPALSTPWSCFTGQPSGAHWLTRPSVPGNWWDPAPRGQGHQQEVVTCPVLPRGPVHCGSLVHPAWWAGPGLSEGLLGLPHG